MCDADDFAADERYAEGRRTGSRRDFGALAGVVGLAAMLPSSAGAADVTESDVIITTPDGQADAYWVHPAAGKHPAVLVWPDIFGLRPAFRQMGRRLAEAGYAVLVVNPYYRSVKAPVLPEGVDPRADANWKKVRAQAQKLTADTNVTDARAFVAWLDRQEPVDTTKKVGTTGYCMGGPMVMRTAAAVPERIGAGATFHGGGLATDRPDSPHLLIPKMKASFLIAIAANDDEGDPKAKDTLKKAFSDAGLTAEIEVYQDTRHGWCPPDSKVYHRDQAERAWARLLALLAKALG
jgi:carboxymethylenebutenolidase